jgi:4-hydroxy-tetrahydrodipicolinate synthase
MAQGGGPHPGDEGAAMTLRDPRFTGAFTAITTPFTPDGGAIDFARLDEQLQFQALGGVRGIVAAGTTGESPTLTDSEYEALVTRSVEAGRRLKLLVVAGTGSNSTAHAVELQRFAASAGADATLSVNPYYNKPTQEGLYRHFSAIADAARIPVILYNIPGRTGVALSPATVERLYAHPNIVANKEATGSTDSASEILMRCPGLALLSGDDSMTLPFAAVGGVGAVSVISNLAPEKASRVCEAFLAGRWPEALALHRELFDLCRALFLETNPIPVKAAMKMLGRDSGTLRLPMTPASAATVEAVGRALTRAGLR